MYISDFWNRCNFGVPNGIYLFCWTPKIGKSPKTDLKLEVFKNRKYTFCGVRNELYFCAEFQSSISYSFFLTEFWIFTYIFQCVDCIFAENAIAWMQIVRQTSKLCQKKTIIDRALKLSHSFFWRNFEFSLIYLNV